MTREAWAGAAANAADASKKGKSTDLKEDMVAVFNYGLGTEPKSIIRANNFNLSKLLFQKEIYSFFTNYLFCTRSTVKKSTVFSVKRPSRLCKN